MHVYSAISLKGVKLSSSVIKRVRRGVKMEQEEPSEIIYLATCIQQYHAFLYFLRQSPTHRNDNQQRRKVRNNVEGARSSVLPQGRSGFVLSMYA